MTNAYERVPGVDDQEAVETRAVLAREDAQTYCELMIANEGHEVIPHGVHLLMHDALRVCHAARRHCVIVMPPEHGKTSQIAKWLVWQVGRNPRLRVGLVSDDEDLAKRNLIAIRKALLSSLNQITFPDLKPDLRRSDSGGEWSARRLYLEGNSAPAFEVFALDGAAEGARLDIVWLDDAVTRKCRHSEAERERVRSAIHGTWLSRVTAGGFCIFTNNVWHREDPVHRMLDSSSFMALWVGYEDVERIYWRVHHPAGGWERGASGTLPLWECWPRQRLEARRDEDRNTFKRLFGGKAIVAEECRFPPVETWRRYSELPPPSDKVRIVAALDPSGGKRADQEDYAALCVVMTTPTDHYLIDAWVARDTPENQIRKCFELHEKWQRLGYRGIEYLQFETMAKDSRWVRMPFDIERDKRKEAGDPSWRLNYFSKAPYENKESRIERLAPPISNGWLLRPDDLESLMREPTERGRSFRNLVHQMEDFPFGDHDDAPDALAAAEDLATNFQPYVKKQDDKKELAQAYAESRLEDAKNRIDGRRRDDNGNWIKPKKRGGLLNNL